MIAQHSLRPASWKARSAPSALGSLMAPTNWRRARVERKCLRTASKLGPNSPSPSRCVIRHSFAVGRKEPSPTRIPVRDRKSTRLNSSHSQISYAVFCLKKKKNQTQHEYFDDKAVRPRPWCRPPVHARLTEVRARDAAGLLSLDVHVATRRFSASPEIHS